MNDTLLTIRKSKPTEAMINQMLDYCKQIGASGDYWGNKEQFEKRHMKIVKWLRELRSEYREELTKVNKDLLTSY